MHTAKRNGVEVKVIETGEVFRSIQACADWIGVDVKSVGRVVNGKPGYKSCHGYHVIRMDGLGPDFDTVLSDNRGYRAIPIRIIETGEEFKTMSQCARSIDGSISSISNIINGKSNRQIYKGYHFEKIER